MCQICFKSFGQLSNFVQHWFGCEYCDKAFRQKSISYYIIIRKGTVNEENIVGPPSHVHFLGSLRKARH